MSWVVVLGASGPRDVPGVCLNRMAGPPHLTALGVQQQLVSSPHHPELWLLALRLLHLAQWTGTLLLLVSIF